MDIQIRKKRGLKMLKVDKRMNQNFFRSLKKKNGPKDWKDLDFEIKGNSKIHAGK